MWFVFFWFCIDGHEGVAAGMDAVSHADGMVKAFSWLPQSGGQWAEIRYVPAGEC